MDTSDKIIAIEESGLRLAYDGCHKIYVIETEFDRTNMRENGYEDKDVFPASEIRRLINESCFLVFVNPASLRYDAPWRIEQGELGDSFGDADV